MDKDEKKSVSALREEAILQFWKENDIFNKSLEKDSPKGEYVFYEGPPTANGKPGIHHLEARAFKDAIPRYKTMRGYHVERKGGWDTHGLPVELQVEKKLGLSSKKAIEEYGIAKFNKECKESVWEYVDIWEKFTERIGFWVDQKNPYVTYHNNYIESVWNVIKEANNQKLLYKDYKVVPWCPRCETVLSSHELAQGYENVKDLSVYAKFKVKLKSDNNVYIVAWTTTPWTLPGNVALAVGEKINYVKIKVGDDFYILAKERLPIIEGEYSIVEELKGKDLIGLEYEPLYPYLQNTILENEKSLPEGATSLQAGKLEKAFKIYNADFVTTEDGTGVVHTAVMYGQDDFELGTKIGLPKHHLVGLDGKFLSGTGFLEGRFVRDEEVAVDIIKDLAHRGLLFKKEKYEHSYPHCWRCKTALIYYARDSWYIGMSSLKDKLVKENEGINWEPSYIREGRFGEWLRDIKDWAISRERYWGTPLPVWVCDKCKKFEVIGSIEDIKNKTKKSGNKYFVMRHGEAENNKLNICAGEPTSPYGLTEKGKEQIISESANLKSKKIDVIITSPYKRTKETADEVAKILNISIDQIITDERLSEVNDGIFNGKPIDDYYAFYSKDRGSKYDKAPEGGESILVAKKRTGDFIYELDNKYSNKNILIISHDDALWSLFSAALALNKTETFTINNDGKFIKNAEIRELNFSPLPHNENYELDLHKPYIDEVGLVCDCRGKLERTKEVMDVWLDSGAMPFAQNHYPFENKNLKYPADFICEAIDQTRGWFYTLHAVGVIMGRGKAYKNVICLGHLLDAKGKKMSKSLGNIVDPLIMIDKYGADTLRLWMYSINQPGESKNFDEKTVSELHSKVFNLLYNVLAFYELYRDKSLESETFNLKSDNVLDKWIIARLHELTENTTKQMDDYKLLEPVRAIREFIDDFSTWYLRRSRERIKNGDVEAKQTLYYVLKTLTKLMAPFTPFASEDIWQKLKNKDDEESVHLAEWPTEKHIFKIFSLFEKNGEVIEEMKEVRDIVTLGLQARQEAGIPVRQPLNKIDLPESLLKYADIIKEELNLKKVVIVDTYIIEAEAGAFNVNLDTEITEDLKKEGQYRELLRAIQDIRKKNGLNPNDVITLVINTDVAGQELINKFKSELMKAVGAKEIQIKENNGAEIKVGELIFKVSLK